MFSHRCVEQHTQVAIAEQQRFGVELREQPQPEQHQAEVGSSAGLEQPVAQGLQPGVAQQHARGERRDERARQSAERIADDIDVGGNARWEVGLQRFHGKAEQEGG